MLPVGLSVASAHAEIWLEDDDGMDGMMIKDDHHGLPEMTRVEFTRDD